jgi:hypothetical protein
METEAIHSNIAEGEDTTSYAEEEEEDISDDFSGKEDDSSDDDFEFKELEKEIYGRLGGPPPELQMAMDKGLQKDRKVIKKSSNKEIKQSTKDKEGLKSNRTPLQEIAPKDNEKVTDDKEAKQIPVPEKAIPTMVPLVMPSIINETHGVKSDESKEVRNTTERTYKPSTNTKEPVGKESDEIEAPQDDCGCIIM